MLTIGFVTYDEQEKGHRNAKFDSSNVSKAENNGKLSSERGALKVEPKARIFPLAKH